MKLFIRKILFFILKVIFPLLIIFYGLSKHHRFLPNTMYYSNQFKKAFENGDFDLIAIGNSKLLSSINNEVLKEQLHLKPVILGYSSANISISKLTLEGYLNKSVKLPKIVLLEVSWFTFNKSRTGFHNISGDLLLTDYHLINSLYKYPNAKNNFKESIKREITFLNKYIEYTDYSKRKETKNNPNKKNYVFNKEHFHKIFPSNIAGVDNILLEDFYEIINVCNKNNIKLVLYTAPEDEEYTNLQIDRKKIKSIYNDVAKRYNNIIYLDYTKGGKLYKKKYENWLSDSHHIAEPKLFTYVLSKNIMELINTLQYKKFD